MSTKSFRVKVRGEQENRGVTSKAPVSVKPPAAHPSRFPFDNATSRQRQTTYEDLCAPYLEHHRPPWSAVLPTNPSATLQTFSPSEYLDNWALATVWSEKIAQCKDLRSEQDFISLVNKTLATWPTFQRNEWEHLAYDDFIVVFVTETKRDGYTSGSPGYNLLCEMICFEDEEEPCKPSKWRRIKISALAGFGDILASVVEPDDMLIITGGLLQHVDNQKVVTISLNVNDDCYTQILRVPGCNFDDDLEMVELIRPVVVKNSNRRRYRFEYTAVSGKSRREVTKHRDYKYGDLGKNLMDSIACIEKQWEFPVPVIQETANSIFMILSDPNLTMFEVKGRFVRRRMNGSPDINMNVVNKTSSSLSTSRRRKTRGMEKVRSCAAWTCFLFTVIFVAMLLLFIAYYQEYVLGYNWYRDGYCQNYK